MPHLGQGFYETLNSPEQQMSSDRFFLFDPISFGSVPASLSSPITQQLKGPLCRYSQDWKYNVEFDERVCRIEVQLFSLGDGL